MINAKLKQLRKIILSPSDFGQWMEAVLKSTLKTLYRSEF